MQEPFSVFAAARFSLGLLLALGLLTWPFKSGPISIPLLTAWICVSGLPPWTNSYFSSGLVTVLGLALLAVNRKSPGPSLVLVTLVPSLSIIVFSAAWKFWVPVFLISSLFEARSLWIKECDLLLLEQSRSRQADRGYRAELLWSGLTELYLACAPERGAEFANQVFEQCDHIVADYGGHLVRGGLQRALYSFSSKADLEQCAQALAVYGRSVNEVLRSASLPALSQVFLLEGAYKEPARPSPAMYPVAQAF